MSTRVYPQGPIGPTPVLRAVAGNRVLATTASYSGLDELLANARRILRALQLEGRLPIVVERHTSRGWVVMPMDVVRPRIDAVGT